jgi:hypothetical protein
VSATDSKDHRYGVRTLLLDLLLLALFTASAGRAHQPAGLGHVLMAFHLMVTLGFPWVERRLLNGQAPIRNDPRS